MLGVHCDGLASHSGERGGGGDAPSRFMLKKLELSAGLMSLTARFNRVDFTLPHLKYSTSVLKGMKN